MKFDRMETMCTEIFFCLILLPIWLANQKKKTLTQQAQYKNRIDVNDLCTTREQSKSTELLVTSDITATVVAVDVTYFFPVMSHAH